MDCRVKPGNDESLRPGYEILHRRDAVDFDIETSEPLWHADKNPRRRVFRKIPCVDRVDGGEFFRRGAVDVALEDVVQRGTCGFDAEFQLLHNQLSLPFD